MFLFALVTGMTIWEFTGLVNERDGVAVNQMISTVAGVYFFLAMAGYNSGMTPAAVFIPYLLTLIYLLVAELYLKQEDPVNDWAYTMMSQLYIALPFSLLNVLAFQSDASGVHYVWTVPLSVFVFLWINDAGAYICGSLLGKHKLFPRISPGKSWEGSIGGGILVILVAVLVWYLLEQYGENALGLSALDGPRPHSRHLRHMGRLGREPFQAHSRHQGQRPRSSWSRRHARPFRLHADGCPRRRSLSLHADVPVSRGTHPHEIEKGCNFAAFCCVIPTRSCLWASG